MPTYFTTGETYEDSIKRKKAEAAKAKKRAGLAQVYKKEQERANVLNKFNTYSTIKSAQDKKYEKTRSRPYETDRLLKDAIGMTSAEAHEYFSQNPYTSYELPYGTKGRQTKSTSMMGYSTNYNKLGAKNAKTNASNAKGLLNAFDNGTEFTPEERELPNIPGMDARWEGNHMNKNISAKQQYIDHYKNDYKTKQERIRDIDPGGNKYSIPGKSTKFVPFDDISNNYGGYSQTPEDKTILSGDEKNKKMHDYYNAKFERGGTMPQPYAGGIGTGQRSDVFDKSMGVKREADDNPKKTGIKGEALTYSAETRDEDLEKTPIPTAKEENITVTQNKVLDLARERRDLNTSTAEETYASEVGAQQAELDAAKADFKNEINEELKQVLSQMSANGQFNSDAMGNLSAASLQLERSIRQKFAERMDRKFSELDRMFTSNKMKLKAQRDKTILDAKNDYLDMEMQHHMNQEESEAAAQEALDEEAKDKRMVLFKESAKKLYGEKKVDSPRFETFMTKLNMIKDWSPDRLEAARANLENMYEELNNHEAPADFVDNLIATRMTEIEGEKALKGAADSVGIELTPEEINYYNRHKKTVVDMLKSGKIKDRLESFKALVAMENATGESPSEGGGWFDGFFSGVKDFVFPEEEDVIPEDQATTDIEGWLNEGSL